MIINNIIHTALLIILSFHIQNDETGSVWFPKLYLRNQSCILGFLAVDPVLFTKDRISALEKTLIDNILDVWISSAKFLPQIGTEHLFEFWLSLLENSPEHSQCSWNLQLCWPVTITEFFSEFFRVCTTC